jgi:hypothetical protein
MFYRSLNYFTRPTLTTRFLSYRFEEHPEQVVSDPKQWNIRAGQAVQASQELHTSDQTSIPDMSVPDYYKKRAELHMRLLELAPHVNSLLQEVYEYPVLYEYDIDLIPQIMANDDYSMTKCPANYCKSSNPNSRAVANMNIKILKSEMKEIVSKLENLEKQKKEYITHINQ